MIIDKEIVIEKAWHFIYIENDNYIYMYTNCNKTSMQLHSSELPKSEFV